MTAKSFACGRSWRGLVAINFNSFIFLFSIIYLDFLVDMRKRMVAISFACGRSQVEMVAIKANNLKQKKQKSVFLLGMRMRAIYFACRRSQVGMVAIKAILATRSSTLLLPQMQTDSRHYSYPKIQMQTDSLHYSKCPKCKLLQECSLKIESEQLLNIVEVNF